MKYILILTMLVGFVYGQVDSTDNLVLPGGLSFPTGENNTIGTDILTFGDLLDYTEYCYDDSLKVHTYRVKVNNFRDCYYETENDMILICQKPKHFEFVHKEPDFPKGFIEWFKQK